MKNSLNKIFPAILAQCCTFAFLSATACVVGFAKTEDTSKVIENEIFSVRYDFFKSSLEITHRPSGKVFVKDLMVNSPDHTKAVEYMPKGGLGLSELSGGNSNEQTVTDPVLGEGKKIVLTGRRSNTSIEIYPGVPFVIIRPTLKASFHPKLAYDVHKYAPALFTLDLGKPAKQLKTLGTGGLLPADKNPGSYLFLTTADPATRNGVVVGWGSQEVISGVVFSEIKDDRVALRAEAYTGHLLLTNNNYKDVKTGKFIRPESLTGSNSKTLTRRHLEAAREAVTLDPLLIGYFDDARLGNEAYADLIARLNHIKLRPQSAVYCTWYADKNGEAGSAKSTRELAPFIAKNLKAFGMDTLQVDDKWQAGTRYTKGRNHNSSHPASHFDRVNPKGPYAEGIAPVARDVNNAGLRFGLWWLPFGRHHFEPEYASKQHWFVHREDGKPYRCQSFGGTCLDLTHPEVLEHLRALSKAMRQWGVTYFKMDGLWTGLATDTYYINDGYKNVPFGDHQPLHDPGKTNIEAYRQGLRTIREAAGPDVFLSGCNVAQSMHTLGASIGLVDAMRIGPDYNHDGKGVQTGPLRGSRLYFLNGKVWWNDPDPVKVRNGTNLNQARLATSWVAHSGQFFLISDWLPNLAPVRLEILKRTMTPHRATTRPLDYFDNNLPETWLLTDTHTNTRRDVLALYNWTRKPRTITAPLERAGLDTTKPHHAFDFWANKPLPDATTEITTQLPPESCQIIALRPAQGHPVLVSTSRHITQGVVDVTEEKWDPATNTLSGTSEIIANDPYELRIAGLGNEWKVSSVKATTPNATDCESLLGGKSSPWSDNEPGWVRIPLSYSGSETPTITVHWKVTFKRKTKQPMPAPQPGA